MFLINTTHSVVEKLFVVCFRHKVVNFIFVVLVKCKFSKGRIRAGEILFATVCINGFLLFITPLSFFIKLKKEKKIKSFKAEPRAKNQTKQLPFFRKEHPIYLFLLVQTCFVLKLIFYKLVICYNLSIEIDKKTFYVQ